MAEIRLKNVGKTYRGGIQAVSDVQTEIENGAFIVVVGPSGCGKSTLLRMIAGLETITEGEIYIGGTLVNQLEPAQRDVAMVFQNYALYPHMSVFDNMAYALKIRGLSRAEIKSRVQAAAETLELTPLLDRKPRQLSGGQRQRVAMGRCIVRQPKVFLFDEPLSNLDAKLRLQMRIELKKLHNTFKTTSVYVTHDQVEAMTLGDVLIVMNLGRAEQIGPPLEVYNRPKTRFVAGFIGSPAMNFLEVTVKGNPCQVVLPGGTLLPAPPRLAAHNAAVLGIRPEHLQLATGSEPTISLLVEFVEALGADTLVHGRIDGNHPLTVRMPGLPPHRCGERIMLTAAPEKHHYFRREDGHRLF